MKTVYVLGNGQLGRMLRQAGEPMGIQVHPVGVESDLTLTPNDDCVITAEIEHWPDTPLTRQLAQRSEFVNRDVFPLLADRYNQKQLLDQLKLATSPWQLLEKPSDWEAIFDKLGKEVVVKRRQGGYDGRGLCMLSQGNVQPLAADLYHRCIVEAKIPFSDEISVIGCRGITGECMFYPISHNYHQDGILRASVSFPYVSSRLQQQAEAMLGTIMHHLNYIGVMAMECFVVGETLLINELAPRVHNSGHWTQNGASISQFEAHLRAILQLPVVKPDVVNNNVMINLIGTALNFDWLTLSLTHLHWYDKAVREGRKVGHLNFSHHDLQALQRTLKHLIAYLPPEYATAINWATQKIY